MTPTAIRHALRSLARTPVFSVTALFTLVLGIGSVAAMFTIAYGVLLKPLPYGNADRLVSVALVVPSPELRQVLQPPGAYYTYKRLARRIDDIGFYRTGNANIWVDASTAAPERVTATWITASTIPLLRVRPLLGRPFTDDEDRANGPDAAVISESLWRSQFHSAPDVIGKTLYANSVRRQVVGVMPDAFQFPSTATRIWLPSKLDRSVSAGDFDYSAVARLADGATPADAQRDLAAVLPRMAELFPRLESGTTTAAWLDESRPRPEVLPLRDEVTGGIARTLWMLAAAASLVLLVACANAANLMLIRADGRQLELAVREALGASRLRILTYFGAESLLLAAGAGALALPAAWAAVRALVLFGPADVPRLAELRADGSTVAFVVIGALVSAAVCSIVPAIRIRRANLSINLRDGARGDTASVTRQRLRSTIAALQIAVALVVVAGSALLLRTSYRLHAERPGFTSRNVITIWTQLPFARYGGDSSAVAFYGRLTEAVSSLSGVRAAGLTSRLPLGDGEQRQQSFRIEGEGRDLLLPVTVIGDGYLDATAIPLIAGRGFEHTGVQRDGDVIVSRRAAATIWNDSTGRAAIGKRITLTPSGPTYTVIGVAGDVRDRDLATGPAAMIYLPHTTVINRASEPQTRRTLALVVRTAGPPTAIVAKVRQIVRELDPTVPIFNVETMDDIVRASTARLSLTLALMSAAAVITLVLGAVGLYGVMAYTVALRTREFGVRLALGADPKQLARAVSARGMRLIAVGVAAGLVLFAAAAPVLRVFLYGVTPGDPVTLASATLALVATGALASWLPAHRASRIDPAVALRAE